MLLSYPLETNLYTFFFSKTTLPFSAKIMKFVEISIPKDVWNHKKNDLN